VIADLGTAGGTVRGIARQLCTESIYQVIYDPAVDLARPARRRRRRRRHRGEQRRGRLTAMGMIQERPVEVEDRLEAGHWEGDLIMGPGNRSAIGMLLERSTRFVILLHMSDGVLTADTVRYAVGIHGDRQERKRPGKRPYSPLSGPAKPARELLDVLKNPQDVLERLRFEGVLWSSHGELGAPSAPVRRGGAKFVER
jgi:hypothetical protein